MFANDHFRQIDAKDIDDHISYLSTNGLTVYNIVIKEDNSTVYAIMGDQGIKILDDQSLNSYAHLYSIDLKQNKITHKFDQKLRRDSKLVLFRNKGVVMEPFRNKKMYVFESPD